MTDFGIHIYHHFVTEVLPAELITSITRIETKLDSLLERSAQMVSEIEEMRLAVERNTTVDQSAVVLMQTMIDKINDLADGATELEALKTQLRSYTAALTGSTDTLATAVAAGTQPTP